MLFAFEPNDDSHGRADGSGHDPHKLPEVPWSVGSEQILKAVWSGREELQWLKQNLHGRKLVA